MPIFRKEEVEVRDDVATGRALRTARTQADISLCEVARRMGISAPYLSDLERGRRNWKDDLCERFQKALKK